MQQLRNLSIACAIASSALVSQQAVGTANVSWPNTVGVGSPNLDACVHYPAVFSGLGAPVATPANANGFPVVVFLHGYGMTGDDYAAIGDTLAEAGIVAVMLNTAQWSYQLMREDARAMYKAIYNEARDPASPFASKFDIHRLGLMGHSMGAAVMAYVLNTDPWVAAVNPGYRCALGIAPVNPGIGQEGSVIDVPLGLVSGQGDTLTPPSSHATPYFHSVDPSEGLKFHYQMGLACDHMNICGLSPSNPAVFARTQSIVTGFFGQFLSGDMDGLEAILGDDGQADPNLAALEVDTVVPQVWSESPLCIGQTTRISVALEGGWGGLLAASSMGPPTQTMIGTLLLDEGSAFAIEECPVVGERLDVLLTVPVLPALLGTTFAVQGAGSAVNSPFTLGSAINFVIAL